MTDKQEDLFELLYQVYAHIQARLVPVGLGTWVFRYGDADTRSTRMSTEQVSEHLAEHFTKRRPDLVEAISEFDVAVLSAVERIVNETADHVGEDSRARWH